MGPARASQKKHGLAITAGELERHLQHLITTFLASSTTSVDLLKMASLAEGDAVVAQLKALGQEHVLEALPNLTPDHPIYKQVRLPFKKRLQHIL
jgi:hypothetical protein